ncbi:MAG: hypothetical protein CBD56_01285 [Candidatus Pelagibacter sp. TMED196]|nr:MAG: hypothetical protein CBD56_01285 [Candidatus Pelagibacter sp. TMED196]
MNNSIINTYLISQFLKTFINVVLIFCCLGLIMNLFEEINFFKNYDVGILMPIKLSLMVIPSIIINLLPFILFISSMVVFIQLKDSRDIIALKTFGFSNVNFLIIFSVSSIFISIVILFVLNPLTSATVKYYEDIKGRYDLDKSHLASINSNGIWIREKEGNNVNIIKSQSLEGNRLINVSIYKFDENYVLYSRLEASEARISENPWVLQNGRKINFDKEKKIEEFLTFKFDSTFNVEKLNSIYSNLDTVSFFNLIANMENLVNKGYNPVLLTEKKHFYLSLPFFLILMVCLASMFTLNSNKREQNTYYILLSILLCVIIFYFKNFSTALGTTEKIPIILSVWSPVIILSLFCSIGVMQINDK